MSQCVACKLILVAITELLPKVYIKKAFENTIFTLKSQPSATNFSKNTNFYS